MTAIASSYASGTSDEPLIGETIGDNLDRVAGEHGDDLCLVSRHQGIRWTYSDFIAEVDRCSRALLAIGVETGDRVGIWSPNRAEWTVVQYATAKIGAILVNVNPSYRTHELAYALGQSGVSVLVTAEEFKASSYLDAIDAVRSDLGELETVVTLGDQSRDITWSDFLDSGEQISMDRVVDCQSRLQFDDPVNIQYTSGTTGSPKGATLTHHNILNNGYFVTAMQRLTAGSGCVSRSRYTTASEW